MLRRPGWIIKDEENIDDLNNTPMSYIDCEAFLRRFLEEINGKRIIPPNFDREIDETIFKHMLEIDFELESSVRERLQMFLKGANLVIPDFLTMHTIRWNGIILPQKTMIT